MISAVWTLEGELRELTGADSAESALRLAGVLTDAEQLSFLRAVSEGWVRGGAETYIYVFDVGSAHRVQRLILKAYVAPPGTGSLVEGLKTLLQRRQLLAQHGVAVPTLFVKGRAVWVEEFIPEELTTALRDEGRQVPLVTDLFLVAVALDRLGFAPISPFSDLRAKGSRAVMIDFGQDIGPPGISIENMSCQDEAFSFLKSKLPTFSDRQLSDCRDVAVSRFLETLLSSISSLTWVELGDL